MNADLMFDRYAGHIIRRARIAVGIKVIFGHNEQRNSAGAFRSVRCPGEHQMDDIVGQIMFAEGDEDFLSLDPVFPGMFTFGDRFGGRTQRADIGSRLRFGEVHRAGPCT